MLASLWSQNAEALAACRGSCTKSEPRKTNVGDLWYMQRCSHDLNDTCVVELTCTDLPECTLDFALCTVRVLYTRLLTSRFDFTAFR